MPKFKFANYLKRDLNAARKQIDQAMDNEQSFNSMMKADEGLNNINQLCDYYNISRIKPEQADYRHSSAQLMAMKSEFDSAQKELTGIKGKNITARKQANNTPEAKMHQILVNKLNVKHGQAMKYVNAARKEGGINAQNINKFYNKVLRYKKRDPMRKAILRKALNDATVDPNKVYQQMQSNKNKASPNYARGSLYKALTRQLGFPKNDATADKIMKMSDEQASELRDLMKHKNFDKRGLTGAVVRDIFMHMDTDLKVKEEVSNIRNLIPAGLEARDVKKLAKYSPRGQLQETLQTFKDMQTSYGFDNKKMMKLHRRARTVGQKLDPAKLLKARSKVRANIDSEFNNAIKPFVGDNAELLQTVQKHPHKKALTDKIIELGKQGALSENDIGTIQVALAQGIGFEKAQGDLNQSAMPPTPPPSPPVSNEGSPQPSAPPQSPRDSSQPSAPPASAVDVEGGKPAKNVLTTLFDNIQNTTTNEVGPNQLQVMDNTSNQILFNVAQVDPGKTTYTQFDPNNIPEQMTKAISQQCRGKPNAQVRINGTPEQIFETIQTLGVDKVSYTQDTIDNLGDFKQQFESMKAQASTPSGPAQNDDALNVSVTTRGAGKAG